MDNLSALERIAYEAIAEILEVKGDTVVPCVAHISEIRNSMNVELMEALRELYRKGIVSVIMDKNKNPQFQIKTPLK